MSRGGRRSGSRALALALVACVAAAGCGADESAAGAAAGPAWRRLDATLAALAEPAPAPERVARFAALDEPEAWSGDAPLVEPPRADRPAWLVFAGKAGRTVRLVRQGELDPRAFNRVRLRAGFTGKGSVQVSLLRAGRVVVQSQEVWLRESGDATYDLSLPYWRDPSGPCDSLQVDVLGGQRRLFLAEVELWLDPLEAYVPDPARGAAPARLLTPTRANWEAIADERRGVGLTHRRPLAAELEAFPGAELVFSCGEPEATLLAAEGVTLEVSLRSLGRSAAMEWRHPVRAAGAPAGSPAWETVRIPLAPLGTGRVAAQFRLVAEGGGAADGGPGAACVLAELGVVSTRALEPAPPSVLLVTSDTHRADHLSSAKGAAGVATPVLDALAARGVQFDRCYTWANVTNPSHIALMTGTHPRDTGILDNESPLARGADTLAERFAEAGWVTWAAISVRHLEDATSGLGQGFDRMLSPFGKDQPCTVAIGRVEDWLAERRDAAPVFLWLHLFDAHVPYAPPPPFAAAYPPADEVVGELPPDVGGKPRSAREVREQRALYKGEVAFLDRELARLLDLPRFRDGIVAVVSDHGESFGAHGVYFDHVGLYPDTLHVPLLLAWPGAPAGARVADLVSQADLGRTLLDLAGLEDAAFPGEDLRRHLAEEGRAPSPHFALHANGLGASVTHREHHLVLHLPRVVRGERVGQHRVELYDLAADPRCERDLVEERFELARELRAGLIRWLAGERDLGWRGEEQADSRLAAELAELGYADVEREAGSSLWVEDACAWCRRFE